VVDNLSTGKQENVPTGAEFLELDLARPDFLADLPDCRFDAVCHLAAQSSGAVSAEEPLYDMQANAISTLLLSRWCLQRGISRFLYASSMAIYGNVEVLPVDETAPCWPLSYYGVSKLTSEHMLRLAASERLSFTSFRMFSVYGPGQNLANLKQGIVSIYLAYVLNHEPIPVKGSFDRFRDLVYIDDVVDAWLAALDNPAAANRVYNVGSGRPTTVRELLDAIITACGYDPRTYPVYEAEPTPGDQFGMQADISRIQAELNWSPTVPLADGLNRMVTWAKSAAMTELGL
jgi:UDP-glucose 4-epimerase